MSMKNCNDTIMNRTRDLPVCSAVPRPTAAPRTSFPYMFDQYRPLHTDIINIRIMKTGSLMEMQNNRKWSLEFQPSIADSNAKIISNIKGYQWVSQNTTLYYGVRCHRVDDMFQPFIIRPSSGLTWWKLKRKITMLHITYIHSMLWLRGGC